jgi:hypothetical protein
MRGAILHDGMQSLPALGLISRSRTAGAGSLSKERTCLLVLCMDCEGHKLANECTSNGFA